MDGWADYSYGRVFTAAWNLAGTVPVEQRWASILEMLLRRCVKPSLVTDPDSLIARWRIDTPRRDDDKYYLPSSSFYLRTRLADLKPAEQALLDSDDLALRLSFYRHFSPWEFKEWPTFLDKDGTEFVDAALYNDQLWRSPQERERLRELTWKAPDLHHSMDMPNSYRAREDYYRKAHPEWFVHEDPAHDMPRRIERIEERLNDLTGTPENSGLLSDLAKQVGSFGRRTTLSRVEAVLDGISSRLASIEQRIDDRNTQKTELSIHDSSPEPAASSTSGRSTLLRTVLLIAAGAGLVLLWKAFSG
jgi:hypothetical protein